MNTHTHFHELQLQLYFSIYILRVIDYCAFRSQNNSDSLLSDFTRRFDYLNAELLKNLSTVNLVQVIHSLSSFFREYNEMGLSKKQGRG